jgi:hypothetical protein
VLQVHTKEPAFFEVSKGGGAFRVQALGEHKKSGNVKMAAIKINPAWK